MMMQLAAWNLAFSKKTNAFSRRNTLVRPIVASSAEMPFAEAAWQIALQTTAEFAPESAENCRARRRASRVPNSRVNLAAKARRGRRCAYPWRRMRVGDGRSLDGERRRAN